MTSNVYMSKNVNHKRIGLYYLLFTYNYGLSGTMLSIISRIELDSSDIRIITMENLNFYNLSITLHGLLMIFFLVMPGLLGSLGNVFIPILIGSPEVGYPRVNNMSLLIVPFSYGLFIVSIGIDFSIGMGWTLYPPLSTSLMYLSVIGVNLIIYGLLFSGISSSLTSINIFGTTDNMK